MPKHRGGGPGVSADYLALPDGLPVPEDDGAADHLAGAEPPDLLLDSSLGAVNYPVFPPDANAGDVLEWLESR